MITRSITQSPRVNQFFSIAERFSANERLFLAKLLLESVVSSDDGDTADWRALSLVSFERDWDNPEDAIYDDWRAIYGIPAR